MVYTIDVSVIRVEILHRVNSKFILTHNAPLIWMRIAQWKFNLLCFFKLIYCFSCLQYLITKSNQSYVLKMPSDKSWAKQWLTNADITQMN